MSDMFVDRVYELLTFDLVIQETNVEMEAPKLHTSLCTAPVKPFFPPELLCMQALQRFAVQELSNFYLDVAKDRLYTSGADSHERRFGTSLSSTSLQATAQNAVDSGTPGSSL